MAVNGTGGMNNLGNNLIDRVGGSSGLGNQTVKGTDNLGGPSFKEALEKLNSGAKGLEAALGAKPAQLKFSNHAVDRMRMRGVNFGPEQLAKISSAIDKARAKGAQETLVLTENSALIVSVKNNTVVTVMDSQSLKENVFTNIDSTVVV